MRGMSACGVDFGTSNSALALPDGQVLALDPLAENPRLYRSVLFFPEDDPRTLVAAEAIARYLDDPTGRFIQSVKTWLPSSSFQSTQIRGTVFRLEDLIALLLRRMRERAAAELGRAVEDVVLGRPAVFSEDPAVEAMAQARLQTAAERAGFRRVRFVIEPIAAALAYEAQLTKEELVLVADFGAGTSDLTLMRLGPSRRGQADRRGDVVASTGVYVGGDRFDAAIMKHKLLPAFGARSTYLLQGRRLDVPQHIHRKLLSWSEMSFIRERPTQELITLMLETSDDIPAIEALHDLVFYNLGYRLFRAIEAAKVELSKRDRTVLTFDEERIHLRVPITRTELERFSAPLLQELETCTDALLAKAALKEPIDSVFLTGGSSQIPAVRALFERRFGAERLRSGDAFTSVAEGLGRAAAHGA